MSLGKLCKYSVIFLAGLAFGFGVVAALTWNTYEARYEAIRIGMSAAEVNAIMGPDSDYSSVEKGGVEKRRWWFQNRRTRSKPVDLGLVRATLPYSESEIQYIEARFDEQGRVSSKRWAVDLWIGTNGTAKWIQTETIRREP
jgi:hypothetical protein